ncbi:MAG: hypothetical protein IH988_06970, partial [Planctomycetes bacterium]|nr:hypothetical protein [Planctomycetota bacterium]
MSDIPPIEDDAAGVGVDHPDGTTSMFTAGFDEPSQLTTVAYQEAAAEGTHRNKTAFLTNNFGIFPTAMTVYNSSSMLIRMVTNAGDEVMYMNLGLVTGSPKIYEGAGLMRKIASNKQDRFYLDGWTLNANGIVNGTLEPVFADADYLAGTEFKLKEGTP